MKPIRRDYLLEVMEGSGLGAGAAVARAGLAAIEPFYAGAMKVRNRLYSAGLLPSARLPRPVVSVGNLTAGGTGKTPLVRWMASRLRDAGRSVAVLSRGYKSRPGQLGDEQMMLDRLLNSPGRSPVSIFANPDRRAAARAALNQRPDIDLFLLDDGFQHRRVGRDLDVVLLSATSPFGFGHVLPRGLLREPVTGLRRAGAVVITHVNRVESSVIESIHQCVRRFNSGVPIYQAVHEPVGFRHVDTLASAAIDEPFASLRGRRFFAFCGLGNPKILHAQLESPRGEYLGYEWFPDHHSYTHEDLASLGQRAQSLGAEILVTTEKDWVKIQPLTGSVSGLPMIWRLDIELRFLNDDATDFLAQVNRILQ